MPYLSPEPSAQDCYLTAFNPTRGEMGRLVEHWRNNDGFHFVFFSDNGEINYTEKGILYRTTFDGSKMEASTTPEDMLDFSEWIASHYLDTSEVVAY